MPSSLFDPDTLMQASELQVLKNEYQKALQEPPWDGQYPCTLRLVAA